MATIFSFSNTILHFHYLSQKTCTHANPVLGHGMIKLLKPLAGTRRIGIRALHRPQEGDLDEKPNRLRNGEIEYPDERELRALLKDTDSHLRSDTAERLSVILEHIGDGENDRLNDRLCKKILTKEQTRQMWKIAGGHNHTHRAAAMLSHEQEKWSGKGWKINGGQSIVERFPLQGSLKMITSRSYNSDEYGVVFPGKSGLLYVERNPIAIPQTQERYELAFEIEDPDRNNFPQSLKKLAKHPLSLNDQLLVYIRSAAPRVLVGQAWKVDQKNSTKICGVLVLVKPRKKYNTYN